MLCSSYISFGHLSFIQLLASLLNADQLKPEDIFSSNHIGNVAQQLLTLVCVYMQCLYATYVHATQPPCVGMIRTYVCMHIMLANCVSCIVN